MLRGARTVYAGLKLLPVQRKVILITREPKRITVDFDLLKKAIEKDYPQHRVVLIKHKKLSPAYLAKALREMYHLATCQACIVDGYIVPVSTLNHRQGLKVAQVWHALGAIKNFGHLASGTAEGPNPQVAEIMQMHKQYSFVTAAGSIPSEVYAKAFDIPESEVKPYGMPRVDYLLNEQEMSARRREILQTYPELKDTKIILYAPTFRRNSFVPYVDLAQALDDKEASLVLVPHPLDRSPLPEDSNVTIGSAFGVLDWLSVADVVITDYSAVTYETTLRDIPLIFWPYDLDDYNINRGLALDYVEEVPGPIVRTAQEAIDTALTISTPDYAAFRSRHLDFVTDKGHLIAEGPDCTGKIITALGLR